MVGVVSSLKREINLGSLDILPKIRLESGGGA
jgi:hypothetical protein